MSLKLHYSWHCAKCRRGCCGGLVESKERLTFTPAYAICRHQMPTDKIAGRDVAKSHRRAIDHPLLLRNDAIMQAGRCYLSMLPEATDAPSAKSLIGKAERSEIKFQAASRKEKKKPAKFICAGTSLKVIYCLGYVDYLGNYTSQIIYQGVYC